MVTKMGRGPAHVSRLVDRRRDEPVDAGRERAAAPPLAVPRHRTSSGLKSVDAADTVDAKNAVSRLVDPIRGYLVVPAVAVR
jgi:hypothetical protein